MIKINWQFGNSSMLVKYSGSPIINKELVFISAGDNINPVLYAIDAKTGREQWSYASDSTRYDSFTSPTSDNNNIYVVSVQGKLVSLDTLTGSLNWKTEVEKSNVSGLLASSPLVINEVIYVGSNNGYLYSFDSNTGEKLGEIKITDDLAENTSVINNSVINTPVCANDGRTICMELSNGNICNGTVWGVKHDNGKIIWSYETITTWNNIGFGWLSSPKTSNEKVFFGGRGYLRALELRTGKELWKYEAPSSQTLLFEPVNFISEIANKIGKVLIDNPFSTFYSPLITDNSIYVVAKNGSFSRFLSLNIDN